MLLLAVLLEVMLNTGLEKSHFGQQLLRLGEQQVLVLCQVGVVAQKTQPIPKQTQGKDVSTVQALYI